MKKLILTSALLLLSAGLAAAENFTQLDQNRDGALSRDEFIKCFDKGDTNKDGKLSSAEHSLMMSSKDSERGRFGSIDSESDLGGRTGSQGSSSTGSSSPNQSDNSSQVRPGSVPQRN